MAKLREQERQHGAQQQADQHRRVQQVDLLQADDLLVGAEHGQGGQGGRTDGEALADGRGGVAHGVELVGARPHFLAQAGHLADAAGVVGDGTVGVDGQLDAGGREHAQGRDGDAVEAGELVGDQDHDAQHDDRQGGGLHAQTQAADDVGGRAGLARPWRCPGPGLLSSAV